MTLVKTANRTIELMHEVLGNWSKKPSIDAKDVATEIRARMTDEEQIEAFAHILPAYVSSKMSAATTSVQFNAVPDQILGKQTAIKKPGKPWSHHQAFSSLRFNAGGGLYVSWPEVTLDLITKSIDALDNKIATSLQNRDWRVAVRTALETHQVSKVKNLPVSVRTSLEKMKGADLAE